MRTIILITLLLLAGCEHKSRADMIIELGFLKQQIATHRDEIEAHKNIANAKEQLARESNVTPKARDEQIAGIKRDYLANILKPTEEIERLVPQIRELETKLGVPLTEVE